MAKHLSIRYVVANQSSSAWFEACACVYLQQQWDERGHCLLHRYFMAEVTATPQSQWPHTGYREARGRRGHLHCWTPGGISGTDGAGVSVRQVVWGAACDSVGHSSYL